MAGHGGRLPSAVNGQISDNSFVLPLSSPRLNGWRSIFTTLSPYVSRTSGRTLRVYARRLLSESDANRNQPISNPPVGLGDRRHAMAIWSPSSVHLGRPSRTSDASDSVTENENFSLNSPQETENIVINMDSSNSRDQHRRPISPATSAANSNNIYSTSSVENRSEDIESNIETTESGNAVDNSDTENPQQEDEHSLSINGEPISDLLERHPELRNVVKAIWHYCVFLLIIIIKLIYDKFMNLLVILLLFVGFLLGNKITKLSVAYQDRSLTSNVILHFLTVLLIPISIYTFYNRTGSTLYYSALLLPSDTRFTSLSELLWVVVVTDLVLKIATVFLKGIIRFIPSCLLDLKFRGHYLAMIEFGSQLYRSLAPVQPWLSYLLDDYAGIEKVFGVFLSALYMLCKGSDIIYKVKNFNNIFWKFLQNSRYGSVPSKDQLKDTGSLCPICQDDFVLPTMLQCKHIFCEQCVARWFDRERTCPMCRTKVADDPRYRDGSTSLAIQLY